MSDKSKSPHLYKKGKLIKIKSLDEDNEKKEYIFSTEKTSVQTIINQCNNLNQIIARCFLTTSKLSHYFGITKDISKDISKNKKPFNQFKSDLAPLATKNDFEKFYEVVEKQNKLIEKHSILLENSTKNNQFVEKVARNANIEGILKETNNKIDNIKEQLKQMIG